jgi:hypothetical protein
VNASADAVETPDVPATRFGGVPWSRLIGLLVVLALALVAARSCQQSQIRIDKDQAIATAEREVEFTASRTQVRLLRQGLNRQPFWIVSLSIPAAEGRSDFRRLAVVRIDANTGKVMEVREGRNVLDGQRLPERRGDGG